MHREGRRDLAADSYLSRSGGYGGSGVSQQQPDSTINDAELVGPPGHPTHQGKCGSVCI